MGLTEGPIGRSRSGRPRRRRNFPTQAPRHGAMNALGRLGLTSLTLLLVACVQAPGASPTPTPSPSPAPSPTPTPNAPAGLAGRQFLSTGVTRDGAPFTLVARSRIPPPLPPRPP